MQPDMWLACNGRSSTSGFTSSVIFQGIPPPPPPSPPPPPPQIMTIVTPLASGLFSSSCTTAGGCSDELLTPLPQAPATNGDDYHFMRPMPSLILRNLELGKNTNAAAAELRGHGTVRGINMSGAAASADGGDTVARPLPILLRPPPAGTEDWSFGWSVLRENNEADVMPAAAAVAAAAVPKPAIVIDHGSGGCGDGSGGAASACTNFHCAGESAAAADIPGRALYSANDGNAGDGGDNAQPYNQHGNGLDEPQGYEPLDVGFNSVSVCDAAVGAADGSGGAATSVSEIAVGGSAGGAGEQDLLKWLFQGALREGPHVGISAAAAAAAATAAATAPTIAAAAAAAAAAAGDGFGGVEDNAGADTVRAPDVPAAGTSRGSGSQHQHQLQLQEQHQHQRQARMPFERCEYVNGGAITSQHLGGVAPPPPPPPPPATDPPTCGLIGWAKDPDGLEKQAEAVVAAAAAAAIAAAAMAAAAEVTTEDEVEVQQRQRRTKRGRKLDKAQAEASSRRVQEVLQRHQVCAPAVPLLPHFHVGFGGDGMGFHTPYISYNQDRDMDDSAGDGGSGSAAQDEGGLAIVPYISAENADVARDATTAGHGAEAGADVLLAEGRGIGGIGGGGGGGGSGGGVASGSGGRLCFECGATSTKCWMSHKQIPGERTCKACYKRYLRHKHYGRVAPLPLCIGEEEDDAYMAEAVEQQSTGSPEDMLRVAAGPLSGHGDVGVGVSMAVRRCYECGTTRTGGNSWKRHKLIDGEMTCSACYKRFMYKGHGSYQRQTPQVMYRR